MALTASEKSSNSSWLVAGFARRVIELGDEAERGTPVDELARDLLDELFGLHPVGDEIGDGGQTETVFAGELHEPRQTGHLAVVVHDLAENGGRGQTGETGEVGSRLGVAGPLEDAAAAGPEGCQIRVVHEPHSPCGREGSRRRSRAAGSWRCNLRLRWC